jgi:peptidoglycan/LPS O-acetylase OafA/YrhL
VEYFSYTPYNNVKNNCKGGKNMRKYYLDNIRWITIVLVVIYHVIYMFNGVQTYGVIGPFQDVQYQDGLLYLLYPWFMVLLFVISGMSSRYYLEKHSEKEFIKSRTGKLLVPGTIGVLVYGWMQGYYNMQISKAFETFDITAIPKPVAFLVLALSGIGVLWFIQMLWLFSILLVLVRKIEKDRLYGICKKCGIVTLLLLGVFVYLAAQVLNTPVITVYRFGIYGAAYFIGYFVLSHDEVTDRLSKFWLPVGIIALVTGIAYTFLYFGENYAVEPFVNNVLACAYGWLMTLTVIAFMKLHGDRANDVTRWMHKRSWGLYIFHYLPLSMAAWYLHIYASGMSAFFHYFLTLIAGFAGGVVLYEMIRRIPILRWCVLGIKKDKCKVEVKVNV